MITKKGCKFCVRYGLPIMPARIAVMSQDDVLPSLSSSLRPPLAARGDTAWTARLLREGYLNIWAEKSARWINYFVTRAGHYYPLPENGKAPHDIISGQRRPCITEPAELASASLITLPVKPAGMKNGRFWFAWSGVQWTDAVRRQYEDAGRRQSMQCFDMDAWLNTGQSEQTVPLARLADTLTEYVSCADSCQMKQWSPAPWKSTSAMEATHLMLAADNLYAGKGAILLLQDPPAVLEDLSALMNHELQENLYANPLYERELALASAIGGLKEAMTRQFERDYLAKSESNERMAIYGARGFIASRHADLPENIYAPIADRKMGGEVAAKWAEYEQYYDPEKKAAFLQKFTLVLTEYNDRIISPRTAMYLDWMKSDGLLGYFRHSFDPLSPACGVGYVLTLSTCIAGMQDKADVIHYFSDLLTGLPTDPDNLLARALVLNQDVLAEQLASAVNTNPDWVALPWSSLADAFKTSLEQVKDGATGAIAVYTGLLSGVISRQIIRAMESKQVYACLVAMGAITEKSFITIEKTGSYKQFVTEVVSRLAKESGLAGRVNADRLRHHVQLEVRRLKITGLPLEKIETKRFLVMVDMDEVKALKGLPPKERAIQLVKLLRLTTDIEAQQFRQWQGSVRYGVHRAGDITPFTIGLISGILQAAALLSTADLENKKTLPADQKEAHDRFFAGVLSLTGTTLNVIETGIKQFSKLVSTSAVMKNPFYGIFMKRLNSAWRVLGTTAGFILAFYDFNHMADRWSKGHQGLAIAYFISGLSGAWLTFTLTGIFSVVSSPKIAAILLIGSAIYLALNERNNIQKWLLLCLWRRVPVDKSHTEKDQILYKEREERDLPIWPTMEMEKEAFKLAIGLGE